MPTYWGLFNWVMNHSFFLGGICWEYSATFSWVQDLYRVFLWPDVDLRDKEWRLKKRSSYKKYNRKRAVTFHFFYSRALSMFLAFFFPILYCSIENTVDENRRFFLHDFWYFKFCMMADHIVEQKKNALRQYISTSRPITTFLWLLVHGRMIWSCHECYYKPEILIFLSFLLNKIFVKKTNPWK